MTTIATDGKTIAADGRMTWTGNYSRASDSVRKIWVEHGVIYACAGLFSHMRPFIDWENLGADPLKYPLPRDGNATSAFLVMKPGSMEYFGSGNPFPIPIETPFALGSGEDFALGAMRAGKSPHEAVEIAAHSTWRLTRTA